MGKSAKLVVGDRAPDGVALDIDGQPVKLSSQWGHSPILLTFLRHFG